MKVKKNKDTHTQHKIGTFNCQGILTSKIKQQMLADDFEKYNMIALAIQETHISGYGAMLLTSSANKSYILYYSGHNKKSENGVGIILPETTKVDFKPINDRICQITTTINNNQKLHIISAYAPTLDKSEKNKDIREKFYTDLDSIIKKHKSRHITIVAGDFNAKTGSAKNKDIYHSTIGKYGKGEINTNGYHLLNFAKTQNFKLTNTFFKHKPSHISTWESPTKFSNYSDKKSNAPRRSKYRNQIDYILTKHHKGLNITNSRSYGGMNTTSDHKLVMITCTIRWPYIKKPKNEPKLNLDGLQDERLRTEYQNEINKLMSQIELSENNQQKWTNIVEVTKKAALNTLGIKPKHRFTTIPDIKELSEKQKHIKLIIDTTKNETKIKSLKTERNRIMTKIHQLLKQHDRNKIEQQLKEIECIKDNPSRMFQAIKQMQRLKPKIPLLINTNEGGLTANESDQSTIIAKHFKNQFYKGKNTNNNHIQPTPMINPFTKEEISNAIYKLKNNKSAGKDGVKAEMLKNSPDIIFEEITKIFNEIAQTGTYPKELVQGTITALQKPGKPKGPVENLRPITLLSMLRKILAICMKKRIIEKLDRHIPPSQAAYRTGRSTTEHVFAIKILAQKAITSKDYPIFLLMLDMSKAFDTVNRDILINELNNTLNRDELNIIKIMLNTELEVRCGNYTSSFFKTDTGVPQGDGLSANQFTYYLAKTLSSIPHNDHEYIEQQPQAPKHITSDHCYSKSTSNLININQEYADDISIISSNPNIIAYNEMTLPTKLSLRNLTINDTKTEKYEIKRNGKEDWKKCKFLGSLLDTEEDIKRRKGLAIAAINTMKEIFYGKLDLKIKVRSFNCYISSIFLYNSELWTITPTIEAAIDAFHRRLIRTSCLNIKWPKIINNENVYNMTKLKPWSASIIKRQLSWFGHLIRLPDDCPAKISLYYAQQTTLKPRGRQKTTWMSMMKKRFDKLNITWDQACILAQDRVEWNKLINPSVTY